ncbi:hypothetical protein FPOAC1_002800 [Fusarium poae]|nr:hypothetical protein FPOAC1_002800 [Fusarium poae]KAG8676792.1 hypothetical protein FPOAC1_002800 [Fusarium poae]
MEDLISLAFTTTTTSGHRPQTTTTTTAAIISGSQAGQSAQPSSSSLPYSPPTSTPRGSGDAPTPTDERFGNRRDGAFFPRYRGVSRGAGEDNFHKGEWGVWVAGLHLAIADGDCGGAGCGGDARGSGGAILSNTAVIK